MHHCIILNNKWEACGIIVVLTHRLQTDNQIFRKIKR